MGLCGQGMVGLRWRFVSMKIKAGLARVRVSLG